MITGHHQTRRSVSGPASALGTEFPPLRTLDPAPGNLRPQTTSFIGRETELAEVAITRLRDVLGDEVYASFARADENMTNAEMAAYAFKLIDHARADLLRAD